MLSIQKLEKLNEIFNNNGWEIDQTHNKLFQRFSTLLGKLEEEQQDFILELTKSYKVYGVSEYEEMLNECLDQLNEAGYFDSKKIIVAPLLEHLKYEKKIKSSFFLGYLLKSNQMSYKEYLLEAKVAVFSYLDKQDLELIKSKEAKLLLVDDYIGSGITACKAIKSYLDTGISEKDITILSLIIDVKGKDKISDLNISCFCSSFGYKTVYDLYEDESKVRNHLNVIAKKMKIGRSYRAGYNDTMGLISMIRTPNNTIPFYWYEGRKKLKAPFPRFKEGEL